MKVDFRIWTAAPTRMRRFFGGYRSSDFVDNPAAASATLFTRVNAITGLLESVTWRPGVTMATRIAAYVIIRLSTAI